MKRQTGKVNTATVYHNSLTDKGQTDDTMGKECLVSSSTAFLEASQLLHCIGMKLYLDE